MTHHVGVPSTLDLTPQQLRVLVYTSHGHTHREIAGQMGLSAWTVKEHQNAMREKLGARTLAHAVAIAFERGIL